MTDLLDVADLRHRVQRAIDAELVHQANVLADLGPDATDLLDVVTALLTGGKRLRAAFLYWGHRAAGRPDADAAVRLASAMEFFQASALLHDDVMDDSDTRRGMPAAHRALATRHHQRGWDGDADRFGVAGAVLAGNLCLAWTDEVFARCGLPHADLDRARPHLDVMRSQLMAGQFLDVVEAVHPWARLADEERIARGRRVIRFKSAKYTVEHPLLIGASAGGLAGPDLDLLSRYGLAVGEAFQLRDDLLGVFGDPVDTGKPAGDDLREGKRTVLVAHTLALADPVDGRRLEGLLGSPDLTATEVAELRRIIAGCGAVVAVESEIDLLAERALGALDAAEGLDPDATEVLTGLVGVATVRSA